MTVFWRCTAAEPHYGGGYLPDHCPACPGGQPCGAPCVETDQHGKLKRAKRPAA